MGRWICDFRPLNRATVKRVTAVGDVFTKTRALAAKLWKSGLDAWSGFNQMGATERAKQLLQIITSMGVRQWTVLPFGVTNVPSYFQEMMLNLYGPRPKEGLPSMLEDAMKDLDAHLSIFMDDLQVGSGDALDNEEWARQDEATARGEAGEGFQQHLQVLGRILGRARLANLKFKLTKCYFCQWEVESLGLFCACGSVRADPKKTMAIAAWPRPSRLEDVERFLATMVFLRDHLSPRYR